MTIYLLYLSIMIMIGALDLLKVKISQRNLLYVFIFLLFVFLDGFRWETGTDWMLYRDYFFSDGKSLGLALEPGYVLLNKIVFFFSQNYTTLLLVISISIYALYLKSITDYALFPFITLLLFYSSFIGYMGMNRQHIALAICLFSFRYILNREVAKFFILIIVAALFHRTALFFLIAIFLDRKFSGNFILISIILVYFLNPVISAFLEPLISYLPHNIAYKLNYYLENDASNSSLGIIFGTLKRALIFLPLYLNRDKLETYFRGFGLMLNLYFLSLLIYVLFNNSIQIFVNRGNLYFGSLFEIFLIPFFIVLVKKNGSQLIVYLLIVIYSVMAFYKSLSVFYDLFVPYKSIFLNLDYIRKLY